MSEHHRASQREDDRDRRRAEKRERKMRERREGPAIRRLRLVRTEDVTPRLRRIVVTGEDLRGFEIHDFAPADKVKLIFPDPTTGQLPMPEPSEKGVRWPGGHKPQTRSYTVRGYDPEAHELSLEFVLHDDGIAGPWALRAQPGDELGVLGPKGARPFPTEAEHYVALGDESALPAISRLIEEAPDGARVTAAIEVADAAEEQPLASRKGAAVEIRWVHRDTTMLAPDQASALETALDELDLGDPAGLFVFAAGESQAMKSLRGRLGERVRLDKHQLSIHGYWKDRSRVGGRIN